MKTDMNNVNGISSELEQEIPMVKNSFDVINLKWNLEINKNFHSGNNEEVINKALLKRVSKLEKKKLAATTFSIETFTSLQ